MYFLKYKVIETEQVESTLDWFRTRPEVLKHCLQPHHLLHHVHYKFHMPHDLLISP